MKYFYEGNLDLLKTNCISIVGTRNPSLWANKETKKIASLLSYNNFTIVSGLARGVDTIALNNANNTIAVLPTSLEQCYPPENKKLKENMSLLLSPFPKQTKTKKWHFLHRNKLIVEISNAIIVIEDKDKGGAAWLAIWANSVNKPVFIPSTFYKNSLYSWQKNLSCAYVYDNYLSLVKALKDKTFRKKIEKKKQLELF